MRIIVFGCGRLGAELSYRLFQHGHQVIVIDHSADAFSNLHHDFRGKTIEGYAISQSVLQRAGMREADGVAAVTNSDVVNAIIGRLAKVEYDIDKIVVRNCDPRWQSMHEIFGLQTMSSTLWGVERVEELLQHSCLRLVYNSNDGDVTLFELVVPHSHNGKEINDILKIDKCIITAIKRGSEHINVEPHTKLVAGDVLHISTNAAGANELRTQFRLPEER